MKTRSREIALLLGIGLGACGGNTDRTPGSDATEPGVSCTGAPLVLGEVDVARAELQVLWTGRRYVVGWIGPSGYELRSLDGARVAAERTFAAPSADPNARPQLLFSAGRLELYYPQSDLGWLDVLDEDLEVVSSGATAMPEPRFRAVQLDANRVALRGSTHTVVDGAAFESPLLYVAALGYDGESLLTSGVLGHGEWNFTGSELSGAYRPPALDFQWSGIRGTGSTGGSFLASSFATGRHAAVVAASHLLTVLVEPNVSVEVPLVADEADASLFWDGARYVVLVADGSATNRDVSAFGVDPAGSAAVDDTVVVSDHASDERFPVGAAAGPGEHGVAWVRGTELAFRCLSFPAQR